MQLDPQSPYASAMAGLTLLMAGRVEEALKHERVATEIAPDSLQATWMLGLALAGASAWEEASEWLGRAVERSSRAPVYLGWWAWSQAASGREEQARQVLGELERRAATEYVSALVYTGIDPRGGGMWPPRGCSGTAAARPSGYRRSSVSRGTRCRFVARVTP